MKYFPTKLDKVRNYKFGMKAVHLIETSLGVDVNSLDLDNLTMHQTATMMWAGLVHEDEKLTPEKVMDLVDDHSDMVTALTEMGEAFAQAFNGGEQAPKNLMATKENPSQ